MRVDKLSNYTVTALFNIIFGLEWSSARHLCSARSLFDNAVHFDPFPAHPAFLLHTLVVRNIPPTFSSLQRIKQN